MTVGAVEFIAEGANVLELAGHKSEKPAHSFLNWLAQEMNAVNQQIQSAEVQVQQMAAGEQDNLHHVMLSLEKASLEFELALQVRNKLLEGYQEIMRMQV